MVMIMIQIRPQQVAGIPILEVVEAKQRGQALPCVIFYHGWRSTKALVLTQARKLAAKGLRVILPDALNHGERSITAISEIPSFTFWQSIQGNLAEFSVLVNFLKTEQLLLDDQISVGGVSMGGITTCALLASHPEIKKAACIMGTPQPLLYRERVIQQATHFKRFVSSDLRPLTDWLAAYDLSRQPEKIAQRKVLFWHGTEDTKIAFRDAYEFYARHKPTTYGANMNFIIGREQGHLVKPVTMDSVADFFAED